LKAKFKFYAYMGNGDLKPTYEGLKVSFSFFSSSLKIYLKPTYEGLKVHREKIKGGENEGFKAYL